MRYRLHKVTIALLVCEINTLASWASCSQLLLYPHSIQSDIFKLINMLITSLLKALAGNFSLRVAKGVKVGCVYRAERMVQLLRTLAALQENPTSIPRSQVTAHDCL